MSSATQAKAGPRAFVRDLNRAWLEKRFAELARFFHPDVVVVESGSGKRLLGRDACVKSYRQFMLHSRVTEFRESRFNADLWDRTAVAAYVFDIRYSTGGVKYHDVGREFFVLVKTGQGCQVVWRTIVISA
jgi:Domain of unknown function (DUF4440)